MLIVHCIVSWKGLAFSMGRSVADKLLDAKEAIDCSRWCYVCADFRCFWIPSRLHSSTTTIFVLKNKVSEVGLLLQTECVWDRWPLVYRPVSQLDHFGAWQSDFLRYSNVCIESLPFIQIDPIASLHYYTNLYLALETSIKHCTCNGFIGAWDYTCHVMEGIAVLLHFVLSACTVIW